MIQKKVSDKGDRNFKFQVSSFKGGMGEGGEGAHQWFQGSSCLVVCVWLDGVFLLSVFCSCVLFVFFLFLFVFFCEFLCGV